MEIIKNKNIYPEEKTPLLEHYSAYTNVFIGLIPFFTTSNNEVLKSSSSKEIITLKQAQETDDIFKKLEHTNGTIYSTRNDYPEEEEIMETGTSILWSHIIKETSIETFKELNKALMTSIGAYRKQLVHESAMNILNTYTESSSIWHPTAGSFGVLVKQGIYKTLKEYSIDEIIVIDEHYEDKRTLEFSNLTQSEFITQIKFKDYYIYTNDGSILFSIDWDYFFFFIAIDNSKIEKDKIESNFEGFWANKTHTHLWTWEKGEIEKLMNKKEARKSWWAKLLNK